METISSPKQSSATNKFLVFTVGSLNLALPVESVEKVVPNTSIYSSGLNEVGFAHLGDRNFTVIDLHRLLFKTSLTEGKTYLILTINSVGESFAVLIPVSPSLMDISLSNIKVLPDSYRRRDSLSIASHVAVTSKEGQEMTIFLLDVDTLLAPSSK